MEGRSKGELKAVRNNTRYSDVVKIHRLYTQVSLTRLVLICKNALRPSISFFCVNVLHVIRSITQLNKVQEDLMPNKSSQD